MKVYIPTQSEINQTSLWGDWSKEPSKFDWYYDDTETCYILEGSATVSDKQGNKIQFKKGDMVQFEKGLECVWEIHETIKKKFRFG
ncbi:cupin domain-containing protein [Bacteroidota bacterium]